MIPSLLSTSGVRCPESDGHIEIGFNPLDSREIAFACRVLSTNSGPAADGGNGVLRSLFGLRERVGGFAGLSGSEFGMLAAAAPACPSQQSLLLSECPWRPDAHSTFTSRCAILVGQSHESIDLPRKLSSERVIADPSPALSESGGGRPTGAARRVLSVLPVDHSNRIGGIRAVQGHCRIGLRQLLGPQTSWVYRVITSE